jgi:hypothetical protein
MLYIYIAEQTPTPKQSEEGVGFVFVIICPTPLILSFFSSFFIHRVAIVTDIEELLYYFFLLFLLLKHLHFPSLFALHHARLWQVTSSSSIIITTTIFIIAELVLFHTTAIAEIAANAAQSNEHHYSDRTQGHLERRQSVACDVCMHFNMECLEYLNERKLKQNFKKKKNKCIKCVCVRVFVV